MIKKRFISIMQIPGNNSRKIKIRFGLRLLGKVLEALF